MPENRPLWLILAPVIFLLLWAGGYTVAKIGLQYAPPMTLLALRFGFVVLIMALTYVKITQTDFELPANQREVTQ